MNDIEMIKKMVNEATYDTVIDYGIGFDGFNHTATINLTVWLPDQETKDYDDSDELKALYNDLKNKYNDLVKEVTNLKNKLDNKINPVDNKLTITSYTLANDENEAREFAKMICDLIKENVGKENDK